MLTEIMTMAFPFNSFFAKTKHLPLVLVVFGSFLPLFKAADGEPIFILGFTKKIWS